MKINSPFRYAGGKHYARKMILECIPEHTTYIEPFFGGGSIFFAKELAKISILNDKDEDLINCYKVIQNNPTELIELLSGLQATRELHKYYRDEFNPQNDIERALRYFYLNRTSYSGIMSKGGCYWGYSDTHSVNPSDWSDKIQKSHEKIKGCKITSKDFVQSLDECLSMENEEIFGFIDPPYFDVDTSKLYRHYFTKEDHIRLRDYLFDNKDMFKFLLTYDNVQGITNMYDWLKNKSDRQWNYHINRSDLNDGKRKIGKEKFLMNYE